MNSTSEDYHKISEVELIYKTSFHIADRPKILRSYEAYELLLQSWDENKLEFIEQFKVLLLNRANRLLGLFELSTGGITGTVADPRLILVSALKANACSVIIAHNHPSGNTEPSGADKELTRKVTEGGRLIDISVLDHIIVTKDAFYSFADEGMMP